MQSKLRCKFFSGFVEIKNKILGLLKTAFEIEMNSEPGKINMFMIKALVLLLFLSLFFNLAISGYVEYPALKKGFEFSFKGSIPFLLVLVTVFFGITCVGLLIFFHKKNYIKSDKNK